MKKTKTLKKMDEKTSTSITEQAIENVLIVHTDQEVLNIRKALRRVASCAIKETEEQCCEDLAYYQGKYLSTLKNDAERDVVEKAFNAVYADFVEDKKHL